MNLLVSTILISIFIFIYYLMVQIFTILFRITGLTKEKAHFQVISLLTNSGFTTKESELITSNRSRRRIAKFVMITGMIFNVFIASLLINLLISINTNDKAENLLIVGISALSLIVLIILIKIPVVSRNLEKLVEKIANKIRKRNHNENVIVELDAYGNKSICEVYLTKLPDELKEKPIQDTGLRSRYNIIVLLVQRNKRTLDTKADLILQEGDKLIVFGKTTNIKDLFNVNIENKEELIDESNINSLQIVDNYGSNALTEIEVKNIPLILKNKTIAESTLKSKYDINVLMIKHENEEKLVDADTKIEVGDKLILIGPYEHIKKVFLEDD